MTVSYTSDVWCDVEDCQMWDYGETAIKPPTKHRTRFIVSQIGWTKKGSKDYCPEHSWKDDDTWTTK